MKLLLDFIMDKPNFHFNACNGNKTRSTECVSDVMKFSWCCSSRDILPNWSAFSCGLYHLLVPDKHVQNEPHINLNIHFRFNMWGETFSFYLSFVFFFFFLLTCIKALRKLYSFSNVITREAYTHIQNQLY